MRNICSERKFLMQGMKIQRGQIEKFDNEEKNYAGTKQSFQSSTGLCSFTLSISVLAGSWGGGKTIPLPFLSHCSSSLGESSPNKK